MLSFLCPYCEKFFHRFSCLQPCGKTFSPGIVWWIIFSDRVVKHFLRGRVVEYFLHGNFPGFFTTPLIIQDFLKIY